MSVSWYSDVYTIKWLIYAVMDQWWDDLNDIYNAQIANELSANARFNRRKWVLIIANRKCNNEKCDISSSDMGCIRVNRKCNIHKCANPEINNDRFANSSSEMGYYKWLQTAQIPNITLSNPQIHHRRWRYLAISMLETAEMQMSLDSFKS